MTVDHAAASPDTPPAPRPEPGSAAPATPAPSAEPAAERHQRPPSPLTMSAPDAAEPEANEPGATERESTPPGATAPDPTPPDATDHGATEPEPAAAATAAANTAGPVATASAPTASDVSGPAEGLVVLRGVSRTFEDRMVVRGIDLVVPRGTILGIIGPSGSGKTTTIRMVTGSIAPTEGEVRVLGREPRKFRRSDREQIGYMPQLFNLYDDLTAGENVDFVASLFGMLFFRRRRRVREVLKVVDLWSARKRRASRLSGGMRRRLELACALVHDPTLIILDEPTAGLDPILRLSVWEELHRLRDAGRTLLVTTQIVGEAEECDAVAMIVNGQVIALAPPDELRRNATNGDLLDIETETMFDASTLLETSGVRQVSQISPRHFRVVVDDAGSALPVVVDRIQADGAEVASAREHRLSFDEIFAILVARNQPEAGAAGAADGTDDREADDHEGRAEDDADGRGRAGVAA